MKLRGMAFVRSRFWEKKKALMTGCMDDRDGAVGERGPAVGRM